MPDRHAVELIARSPSLETHHTVSKMADVAPSLYTALAEPVTADGPGPGTIHTFAIETVDNDHASSAASLLGSASRIPGPDPGTRITEAIETVDDDFAAGHFAALTMDASDPRPNPGTAMTATVETIDEDASVVLGLLF